MDTTNAQHTRYYWWSRSSFVISAFSITGLPSCTSLITLLSIVSMQADGIMAYLWPIKKKHTDRKPKTNKTFPVKWQNYYWVHVYEVHSIFLSRKLQTKMIFGASTIFSLLSPSKDHGFTVQLFLRPYYGGLLLVT